MLKSPLAAQEVGSCPARVPWPRAAAARRLGPASAGARELAVPEPANFGEPVQQGRHAALPDIRHRPREVVHREVPHQGHTDRRAGREGQLLLVAEGRQRAEGTLISAKHFARHGLLLQ